jgi:hypothetical protein
MKVMLDPKMVAASTQGAARFEHGVVAVPARITASSQGALTIVDKPRLHLLVSSLCYRSKKHFCLKNFDEEFFRPTPTDNLLLDHPASHKASLRT